MRVSQGLISILAPALLALGGTAHAQYAPLGDHYPRMGNGGGIASTAAPPTGHYSTNIPLEIPAPRGDLGVPLSIVYTGGHTVGAPGLGWSMPLATVRVSDDFSRRKPALIPPGIPSGAPYVPMRVFLDLGSGPMLMNRVAGDLFRPFVATSYLELIQVAATRSWVARDPAGREFVFEQPAMLIDPSLWLLTQVRDRTGENRVELVYEFDDHAFCGLPQDVRLVEIAYSFAPDGGCPKHRVLLEYAHWQHPVGSMSSEDMDLLNTCGGGGTPTVYNQVLGVFAADTTFTARTQILTEIDVWSQTDTSCAPAGERRLRSYVLDYAPDADTGLPRLMEVDELGTDDALTRPVRRYEYGSVFETTSSGPALHFGVASSAPLPAFSAGDHDGIGASDKAGDGVATRHLFRDMTGDGLPDYVMQGSYGLMVGRNITTPAGTRFDLDEFAVSLPVAVGWQEFEETAASFRLFCDVMVPPIDPSDCEGDTHREETWTALIDWNGDGRVDVVSANNYADRDYWTVWLNIPDPVFGPTKVYWLFRLVDIRALRQAVRDAGHAIDEDAHLPLSRARSWRGSRVEHCREYTVVQGSPGDPWVWQASECEFDDAGVPTTYPFYSIDRFGKKWVEWKLEDVNGDGLPDFTFADAPARYERQVFQKYPGAPTSDDDCTPECPDLPDALPSGLPLGASAWCRCVDREEIVSDVTAVQVFHNISNGLLAFAAEPALVLSTECGLERWAEGTALGEETPQQRMSCGFVEANGDGVVDYADTSSIRLRSGANGDSSSVAIPLPGPVMVFKTTREPESATPGLCPDGEDYEFENLTALVDVTGDGIPDYVAKDVSWTVRPGTGAGFAPARAIHGLDALARVQAFCNEDLSITSHGVLDIDGDGRLDAVHREEGSASLQIARLEGAVGLPGVIDGGLLVAERNGRGAVTRLEYVNAKTDVSTEHQIPQAEIVLGSVATVADLGLGASFAPIRYAYGGARLHYNPLLARWQFPGYDRTVTLRGLSPEEGLVEGRLVLHDVLGSDDGLSGYEAHALAGRSVDMHTLEGAFDGDPWQHLTVDPEADVRWRGHTHLQHATVGVSHDSSIPADCQDQDPYSTLLSGIDLCDITGLAHASVLDTWVGDDPPGVSNAQVRTVVTTTVDEFARPTRVRLESSGDPTICQDFTYAASDEDPTRILDAVATERVTNCASGQSAIVYAAASYLYDESSIGGSLTTGLVTESRVERRRTSDGLLLGTTVETASHDSFGNLESLTRQRSDGGGTKTMTVEVWERDPFELVATQTVSTASGVTDPLVRDVEYDPVTMLPRRHTDENGVSLETEHDSFGRPTDTWVVPGDGIRYRVGRIVHVDDPLPIGGDPLRRDESPRVEVTLWDAWTPEDDPDPPPTTYTQYFDEFGRSRFTERFFGPDYAGSSLIVDKVDFDGLGRPLFAPDAFEPSAFGPLLYGTSFYYDLTDRKQCAILGYGYLPLPFTHEGVERFPSCETTQYAGQRTIVRDQGPNEISWTRPQAGAYDERILTGRGRVVGHERWQDGIRLDSASFEHDALGQLTGTIRHRQPATASAPVTWSYVRDSFGALLEAQEPGTAVVRYAYDEWGLPILTTWTSGGVERQVRTEHDGYGRPLVIDLLRVEGSGATTNEASTRYGYDRPSGDPEHDEADYLRGRLSWSDDGATTTLYDYDALGQPATTTWLAAGDVFRQTETRALNGRLDELRFVLPDATRDEVVSYAYDSAGWLRWIGSDALEDIFVADSYDLLGRPQRITYGNDVQQDFVYASTGRRQLREIAINASSETRRRLFGPRDGGDLLEGVEDHVLVGPATIFARQMSYTYDALDRLAQADVSLGTGATWLPAGSETFEYDALGSLIRQVASSPSSADYRTWTFSAVATDPDRLCSAAYSVGPTIPAVPPDSTTCDYRYDDLGNVESLANGAAVTSFAYDASGRLAEIKLGDDTTSIAYGALGEVSRVDRIAGSDALRADQRLGDNLEISLFEDPSLGMTRPIIERRIPGPFGHAAFVRRLDPSTVEMLHGHGDYTANRWFTDDDGAVTEAVDFSPYGALTVDTGGDLDLGSSKYLWNGGDTFRSLGLVQVGARLYEPRSGRFLQRDPVVAERRSTQSHPYSFAFQDPVNFADQSGLDPSFCDPLAPSCTGLDLQFTAEVWLSAAIALAPYDGGYQQTLYQLYFRSTPFRVPYDASIAGELMQGSPTGFEERIGGPNALREFSYMDIDVAYGLRGYVWSPEGTNTYQVFDREGKITEFGLTGNLESEGIGPIEYVLPGGLAKKGAGLVGAGIIGRLRARAATAAWKAGKVLAGKQAARWLGHGGAKLVKHHIFPQAFREWFARKGVNIERFTKLIPEALHKQLHSGKGGGIWNAAWRKFIAENPEALPADIMKFGAKLEVRWGIEVAPTVPYSF